MENEIRINNPNKELFAIRDCYLEITLNNGDTYLTPVYPLVLFSGNWKYMYMDFGLCHPTVGVMYSSIEVNVPEALMKSFKIGDNVTFELNFKEK